MAYHPITDAEWRYLKRRFRGLWGGRADERGTYVSRSENEVRNLFNEGLPDSGVDAAERKRARAIVRERVRDFSREAYADPYFELEWERAITHKPELANYPAMSENRRLLWEAYYMRDQTEETRKKARKAWRKLAQTAPHNDDQVWEDT
jgi:non-homologous end joining protein Ku